MVNQVSNQVVVLEGEVMKNLPNTLFEVKVKDSEVVILCYLSGKMRKHYIKILPGDKVRFEVTQYDMGRGRIVFRQAA
jgi:translation initiation factor IF-1